jgi:hypothetical protein
MDDKADTFPWIKELTQANLLAVNDVLLDIKDEIQLTDRASIPLLPTVVRFAELMPADGINFRDRYCEIRWKAAEFLKSKGVVQSVDAKHQRYDHRWRGRIELTCSREVIGAALSQVTQERERRAKPEEVSTVPANTSNSEPPRTAVDEAPSQKDHPGERIAAFFFGVVFTTALLVLAIAVPHPSDFQYNVFKTVISLAAAGVVAMIPGFIRVEIKDWIRAGGALAVFVLVYFYNPAQLLTSSPPTSDGTNNSGLTRQVGTGHPPVPAVGEDAALLKRAKTELEHRHFPDFKEAVNRLRNIDVGDDYGDTLVHHAAKDQQIEYLRYLLERGANPCPVDKSHNTPMDLAEGEDVKALLRSKGCK